MNPERAYGHNLHSFTIQVPTLRAKRVASAPFALLTAGRLAERSIQNWIGPPAGNYTRGGVVSCIGNHYKCLKIFSNPVIC